MLLMWLCFCFFFKQKTAYEMRISDWSSDVCSSDLIADGQARTDDLLVQAAAAEIRVRGRAGLVAQDYDQMVDVRPKAGSVFPAVGALAAGPVGIAVGALAQLVLQKPLKRAARTLYHVTGPWAAPAVKVVEKGSPETVPAVPIPQPDRKSTRLNSST